MTYVTTKKELEIAVERKDEEIMVTGKLAIKMKGFVKLQKLSNKQRATLIAFVTGAGAAMIAGIAVAAATAIPTGGLSIAGMTATFIVAATSAGVSSGTAVAIVALVCATGLSALALLKGYDCEVKAGKDLYFKAKKN